MDFGMADPSLDSEDLENYCIDNTTNAILEKHGVSRDQTLTSLLCVLWDDYYHHENARHERKRTAAGTGQATPHDDDGRVPLICVFLEAVLEQISHRSNFIVNVVKGEPIGEDGQIDEDYKALNAIIEVLEATMKFTDLEMKQVYGAE